MRRPLLARILFVAVLAAAPALADDTNAPSDQYEQFDGSSATIKDTFTKLEWDRSRVAQNVDLSAASFHCSTVALPPTGRVPTVKELLTILNEQPVARYEFGQNVPKMVSANAFADSTPINLPYWTQTPALGVGANMVWAVDFKTGKMTALDKTTGKANVRCVQ
jgi:hypothetical protein